MSKKKFTDGLESLFGDTSEDTFGGSLLVAEEPKPKAVRKRRGSSRKNFTTDLDTLLEDALKETIIEQTQKTDKAFESKSKSIQTKQRSRKPLSGLDALIRRTVEGSTIEISNDVTKRVTFVFEKQKLDKLKRIARIEKAYLKDILSQIVSEYIQKYEVQKGGIQ